MKKGFTLIELLAVIVILAIVSLIAIPLIMNVIETSKKGAIKDSAYGLISASEAYVANNLKNGLENNTKFTCSKNKCVSDDNKEITFKGKVENGTLIISTSNKVLVCVDDGEYYALKLENEEKVTNGEGTCGSYEEENGTFEIISDIDALKAQYEAEIKRLKEDYETEISELQYELDNIPPSELKIVTIGSSDTQATRTFDVRSILPNYQELTASNFYFVSIGFNNGGRPYENNLSMHGVRNISYNPSTGIVTVPYSYMTWKDYIWYTQYTLVAVYVGE